MSQLAPPLLSASHAAEYTGLSLRSIRHLLQTDRIPVTRVGKRVYLRKTDLDTLIESGTAVFSQQKEYCEHIFSTYTESVTECHGCGERKETK